MTSSTLLTAWLLSVIVDKTVFAHSARQERFVLTYHNRQKIPPYNQTTKITTIQNHHCLWASKNMKSRSYWTIAQPLMSAPTGRKQTCTKSPRKIDASKNKSKQ